jgi:hypothetical protein
MFSELRMANEYVAVRVVFIYCLGICLEGLRMPRHQGSIVSVLVEIQTQYLQSTSLKQYCLSTFVPYK